MRTLSLSNACQQQSVKSPASLAPSMLNAPFKQMRRRSPSLFIYITAPRRRRRAKQRVLAVSFTLKWIALSFSLDSCLQLTAFFKIISEPT